MPPAVRVRADFESVYPGASREATECAMNLVKTGDMVVNRVAAILREFGLSPAGGLVLSMLADAREPPSQAEVKQRLLVSGPTVTGVLDSLERRGLVRRVFNPSDRRRRHVEITADGSLQYDLNQPVQLEAVAPLVQPDQFVTVDLPQPTLHA